MIRIPIWPGVGVTFGGTPNPSAVRLTLPKPARLVRLVSKRGWMVLLVTYDWRAPVDKPAAATPAAPTTKE